MVYRGSEIPEIDGHHVYSAWYNQTIRSLRLVDCQATEVIDWTDNLGEVGQVNGFGVGGDGEMYLVTHDCTVAKFAARR